MAGVGSAPWGAIRVLASVAFSVGLVLVVVGGAEFFTGNSLIVMAWASRRVSTRAIGSTTLRARSSLAVAIRVTVEDYLPRGLEPTLVIDGAPVSAVSGIAGVRDRVTTLSFLVEDPNILKDSASLELQWGRRSADAREVPGVLRRGAIQSPDPDESRRLGLPSLADWLSAARLPRSKPPGGPGRPPGHTPRHSDHMPCWSS
jgi:formate/nitrite transporter